MIECFFHSVMALCIAVLLLNIVMKLLCVWFSSVDKVSEFNKRNSSVSTQL